MRGGLTHIPDDLLGSRFGEGSAKDAFGSANRSQFDRLQQSALPINPSPVHP
jgi:hypothetical protein